MSNEERDIKVILEFLKKDKKKKVKEEQKKSEEKTKREIINKGDNIQPSQGLELEIKRTVTKTLESSVETAPVNEVKEQVNVNYRKPEEDLYIPYASYQKTYTLASQEKEVKIREEEPKKKKKSTE